MIKSKMITWTVRLSMSLIIGIFILILFSPYGSNSKYNKKVLVVETEIKAPISQLYDYMAISQNASDWSTFVKEIKNINMVDEGELGAKRRCFGKEEGIVWDEEILSVVPNKKRLLNVYNTQGFPMMADHLLTEQLYEPISGNQTKLKLSLFFKEGKRNLFSEFKMYLAAYLVADIFADNLQNIKSINEQMRT